jgi:hypothetical protein
MDTDSKLQTPNFKLQGRFKLQLKDSTHGDTRIKNFPGGVFTFLYTPRRGVIIASDEASKEHDLPLVRW